MHGPQLLLSCVLALSLVSAASAQGVRSLAGSPHESAAYSQARKLSYSAFAPPSPVQSDSVMAPNVQAPSMEEACDSCCFDFNLCHLPCHYVEIDGLFWERIGTGCDEVVVINGNTGAPLLNTDSLDFDGTGGIRILVGWQPHRECAHCCAWELSYFGIYDWSATSSVTGAGNLALPGDLGLSSNNFFGADEIALRYDSQFQNLELNCIHACCFDDCTRLDFLAGFRYIYFNDDLVITGTDLQEGTSDYHVNATNNLYGVQLGGRWNHAWCRWAVQVTGKAGIFYNDAQQRQVVTDFPNAPTPLVLRDATGSDESVAMLGELGVVFIRPITDTWSLRLGYTAIGVGGVALATDQLDFSDPFASGTGLANSGWFFAHGGLIGVQAGW
jgi:hypothetical protein